MPPIKLFNTNLPHAAFHFHWCSLQLICFKKDRSQIYFQDRQGKWEKWNCSGLSQATPSLSCSVSVCRWPSTLSTPSAVLQGCFLRPTLLLVKPTKELTIITINRQQRTCKLSTVLFYKPVSLSAVVYFQSNQEQTILIENKYTTDFWEIGVWRGSSWKIPCLIWNVFFCFTEQFYNINDVLLTYISLRFINFKAMVFVCKRYGFLSLLYGSLISWLNKSPCWVSLFFLSNTKGHSVGWIQWQNRQKRVNVQHKDYNADSSSLFGQYPTLKFF